MMLPAALALVTAAAVSGALPSAQAAQTASFVAPRVFEELAPFEVLAHTRALADARPRSVDELRWLFDLYSGHHYAHTPEWEWNPLFDKVPANPDLAIRLRAEIFAACEDPDTLGCGGEFVFGYVSRSGMFHIKLLPDNRDPEIDPKFILSFPTGRATFKVIDLKPFGTRMPSYSEMDEAPALRRAGFQCRVQSADRKDTIDPKMAATIKRLQAEYRRTRKVVPDFDVQCTTDIRGFFPVHSKTGEDLQLLTGHMSPRGSKVQFENPILLVTPQTLYFTARIDKSRTLD